VQDKVENPIARALLSQSIGAGAAIAIDPAVWEIKIVNKT
jgi:hypothetical protein